MSRLPSQPPRGVILIEIILVIGILSLLLHAVATLVIATYDVLGYSRAKITARHLASEKIELLRNLPYSQIGIAGGIPAGPLPAQETIALQGMDYLVLTSVIYVDDPFDQLAPQDTLPTDYKRARVEVRWGSASASPRSIALVTDFSPSTIETATSGGTLELIVVNAQANPVVQAQVNVLNQSVSPNINQNYLTNEQGKVILPGSPPCFECYHITVTKPDFSTDKTYTTSEVSFPAKPPLTIIDQRLTQSTFVIDELSRLSITSVPSGTAFRLFGAKTIGTDLNNQPVYKYDQALYSPITLSRLEWDTYTLSLANTGRDLAGSNPLSPFALVPGASLNLSFTSALHQDYSFLLAVTDASGSALPQAHVTLADQTLVTGDPADPDFGQVFFSPLTYAIYSLEATKSGYLTSAFSATVSGNLIDRVILNHE